MGQQPSVPASWSGNSAFDWPVNKCGDGLKDKNAIQLMFIVGDERIAHPPLVTRAVKQCLGKKNKIEIKDAI